MAKILLEGLLLEMQKTKDLITEFNTLPGRRNLVESIIKKKDILEAEKAIAKGDVVQMLICFKKLKFS